MRSILDDVREMIASLPPKPELNGRVVVSDMLPWEEVGIEALFERPLWRRFLSGRTTDVRAKLGRPKVFRLEDGTLVMAPEQAAAARALAESRGRIFSGLGIPASVLGVGL